MLDYVTQFHEHLKQVNALAKVTLSDSQSDMKRHYDRSAESRSFEVGDKVLVLLPITSSVFAA